MKQKNKRARDRFIAFDEYLGKKYAKELKQLLQDDLYDGYDGDATISVNKTTAKIKPVIYWQDSATEISGIITYAAECEIHCDERTDVCECEINISLNACLEGGRVDCDFYPFRKRLNEIKHQRPHDCIDRYLLPKAGTRRVEQICETILRHYCHDAIARNEIVAPADLAEALGLKISYLRLSGMDSKGSLLIMEDTTLPVCPYHNMDYVEYRTVGQHTIVINENCSRKYRNIGNNITHECYHYAGQKLFNLFQGIARSEYPSLGSNRLQHNSDEADTYGWMEWQAFIGSAFLRYPGSYAREEAPGALKMYAATSKHAGEMYDSAIRYIADERSLSAFTVCKVFRYIKHIPAKGTFNCANGLPVPPFAFDKYKLMGSYTYVLDLCDVMRLYAKNEKLRNGLRDGVFVYASGFICVNSPEFVRLNEDGQYELTDVARTRVDRCCLRFHITYVRRIEDEYQYGILSCEENEIIYKSSLAEQCDCETGIIGSSFAAFHAIQELPVKFSDTVRYYREKNNLLEYELADLAEVSEKTIQRIENGITKGVSLSVALRLAYALHLRTVYLSNFLSKAKFVPDNTPAGRALEFIMFYFDSLSIEQLKAAAREYESILKADSADEAIKAVAGNEKKTVPVLGQSKAPAV